MCGPDRRDQSHAEHRERGCGQERGVEDADAGIDCCDRQRRREGEDESDHCRRDHIEPAGIGERAEELAIVAQHQQQHQRDRQQDPGQRLHQRSDCAERRAWDEHGGGGSDHERGEAAVEDAGVAETAVQRVLDPEHLAGGIGA